jgi:hypothetical protein
MANENQVIRAVEGINSRLKESNCPVRVQVAGKKALVLRATLPNRDGAQSKRHNIRLGVSASKEGLRRIEQEAYVLARRIADGSFNWSQYPSQKEIRADSTGQTTADLIDRFKSQYMSSNKIQEHTWKNTWGATLAKLPQDVNLNEAQAQTYVITTIGARGDVYK